MRARIVALVAAASLAVAANVAPAASAETVIRIGGTGMGLALAQELGDAYARETPGVRVVVLPSMGSTGGMLALADRAIEIGLAGRALKAKESALGLVPAVCLITPLVFATSHPAPSGIDVSDLPAIYGDPAPTWADGTPLKVIMRGRSGSEHPYLAERVNGLQPAFELAFLRSDVATGKTDQENARLAERIAGSFAIMTLLQIRSENPSLNVVPVNGAVPTAEDAAAGKYPFPIELCFVRRADISPSAQGFVDFLRTDTALRIMAHREAAPAR